jgi:hypothetical protein
MSRVTIAPAGERYSYQNPEMAAIMRNGSKDRGQPVQVTAPDTAVFTKEVIHEYVRSQLPQELICLADGPGSTPIQITGCHAKVANTGPFFDYATTLVNMFFSSAVNDAISGMTGLPNTSEWYMSVRLFPSFKALRAAGVNRIRISSENAEFVRIGFVVPLGARNEEIRLLLANGKSGAVSERTERALYNTGPNVFPPSVLRSQACYIDTADRRERAYERLEGASVAVFILHLTTLEAPQTLMPNAIYNCTKCLGPAAAGAIRISDLNGVGSASPTTKGVEWNKDKTRLIRRAVTKDIKRDQRDYADDLDDMYAAPQETRTGVIRTYADEDEDKPIPQAMRPHRQAALHEYAEDATDEQEAARSGCGAGLATKTYVSDSDEEVDMPIARPINLMTYAPDDE